MDLLKILDGKFAVIKNVPNSSEGKKLLSLGLSPGEIIQKVSGMSGPGIITLEHSGRYFALSSEVAGKITVERQN